MASCKERHMSSADFFFNTINELPELIPDPVGSPLSIKNRFMEFHDGKMFLNRPAAEKACRAAGLILDYPERLGDSLQQHPAFLRGNVPHRFSANKEKVVKVMVFDLARMED